jgi:Thiolase, N-terminal domain
VVTTDEHPRPDTTMEALSALRPIRAKLDPAATVTAGNSSGQNDGAAVCVVTTADLARTHGLRPLARMVSWAVAGVPPRTMGIGPVPATSGYSADPSCWDQTAKEPASARISLFARTGEPPKCLIYRGSSGKQPRRRPRSCLATPGSARSRAAPPERGRGQWVKRVLTRITLTVVPPRMLSRALRRRWCRPTVTVSAVSGAIRRAGSVSGRPRRQ